MSFAEISQVGVFERTATPAPWGGDEFVRYETIILEPPKQSVSLVPVIAAVLPSFVSGILFGIMVVT